MQVGRAASSGLEGTALFPRLRRLNLHQNPAETLHIRRLENGLERPCGRSRPAPRHLASLVAADAFAGELTRGSFGTIPASEETTNTQRFEADSLAGGPGFEPGLTESESPRRVLRRAALRQTCRESRMQKLRVSRPGNWPRGGAVAIEAKI